MDDLGGITERFALAKAIAREAGLVALGHFGNRSALTVDVKTNGQDIVSIADKEIETLLRMRINAAFPDDSILGEEYGLERGSSGFTWVMDPIDGTSPFVFGIPAWCVSIAVMQGDEIVAGIIYAPARDELFMASRGGGAWLNGQQISVLHGATVQSGVVGVGASHRVPGRVVAGFIERLLGQGGMFIRNGSGALMLAYVAAGRLAAYWEPHMNAWDCFAGLLICREAGGRIVSPGKWSGIEAGGLVLAGTPSIWPEMCELAGVPTLPGSERFASWASPEA